MLYITTRDAKDAHTANKTLTADYASDGGLYIPRRMPRFQPDEIADLRNQSFNETVAMILNQFFSVQLSGWDVDFSIGRNPIKVVPIGRKLLIAQTWCNLDNRYAYIERNLFQKLCKGREVAASPTHWLKIAVRIAVLFGIYSELLSTKQMNTFQTLDIGLNATNPICLVAAWYAKEMGLPLNMIICGSKDLGDLWDLVHRDELNTSGLNDETRAGIEQLIYCAYGAKEANAYLTAAGAKRIYRVPEESALKISDYVFCSVIGETRIPNVINSVLRTDGFLLDTNTAPAYGAVQDYRAKSGSNTLTLLLSEVNPVLEPEQIMSATGLSTDKFYALCKKL